jgi:hypothetical protein
MLDAKLVCCDAVISFFFCLFLQRALEKYYHCWWWWYTMVKLDAAGQNPFSLVVLEQKI